MNRSFYSSQRLQDVSSTAHRPSGFRVLLKKRNIQGLDQAEAIDAQSIKS